MLTLIFPSEAMQIRSEMASTAPKAQQDPQLAWSLINEIDGHCGHWVRASKLSGISFFKCSGKLFLGKRVPPLLAPRSRLTRSSSCGWKFLPAYEVSKSDY